MNAFISLCIRGIGSVGNLALLLLISNLYGDGETGKYVSVLASSILIAVCAGMGVQRYILFKFNNKEGMIAENFLPLFIVFTIVTAILSVVGILAIALGHYWIGTSVATGAIILLTLIIAEYNICIGKPNFSFLFSTGMTPLFASIIIGFLWVNDIESIDILWVLYVSNLVVLMIAYKLTFGNVKLTTSYRELLGITVSFRRENRRILAYWYSSINDIVLARIFPLLAPFFLSDGSIGRISIVLGIASFGGTILQIGRALYGPRISKLNAIKSSKVVILSSLHRTQATTLSISLITYLPVIIMSQTISQAIDPTNFEQISHLIIVVSVCQILRSLFGISETTLSLSKYPKLEALLITLSIFFVVFVTLILGPKSEENWVYAIMSVMILRAGIAYALVNSEYLYRN